MQMFPKLLEDRSGHLHDPEAIGLGVALEELAPELAEAPFDRQASEIVEIPSL
jgi:hypothetical protein